MEFENKYGKLNGKGNGNGVNNNGIRMDIDGKQSNVRPVKEQIGSGINENDIVFFMKGKEIDLNSDTLTLNDLPFKFYGKIAISKKKTNAGIVFGASTVEGSTDVTISSSKVICPSCKKFK